jgi:alpha-L-fucosidase
MAVYTEDYVLKPKPTQGDTSWFTQDRFGIFLHWGMYALPARHEWVQSREEIPPETYRKYFERFNPTAYNPSEWARIAREAGMKYAVITTKHHEGFCLWDTQYTDYKVTNTPYGHDVLKQFVEAFRAEGLRIGFYYSLLDWHHPDFLIDAHHPLRHHPDVAKLNAGRSMQRYAEYMRNQIRELLTQYAPIDILWCDFSYPVLEYNGLPGKGRSDWESQKLLTLVRGLCPGIMINNRLDLSPEQADFFTPEQVQPTEWYKVNGEAVVWEACHTLSGSWGYHRDESTWKSPEQLIHLLIDSVACGGNLLMNVGPTPLGTFDPRAISALRVYADWMALHAEAIYNCTQSEFKAPRDCRLTQNGKKLYIHIFAWPFRYLYLEALADKVAYARFLHDSSEVLLSPPPWENAQMQAHASTLILTLPIVKPAVIVPVIELTLK